MSPFIVVEPWERCFELFRMQNSQDFLKLCPWTPLVRFYSASRLPSCTTIFFFAMLVETLVCPPSLPSPKKKTGFWTSFCLFTLVYYKYYKWQSYGVWFLRYGAWQTEFFVILDYFFSFYELQAYLGKT